MSSLLYSVIGICQYIGFKLLHVLVLCFQIYVDTNCVEDSPNVHKLESKWYL